MRVAVAAGPAGGAPRSLPAASGAPAARPFAQELERATRHLERASHGATAGRETARGRRSPAPAEARDSELWDADPWPAGVAGSLPPPGDPASALRWGALQLQSELWAWILEQSLNAGEGGLFGQGFSGSVYGDWFVRSLAVLLAREEDGGLGAALVEQLGGPLTGADGREGPGKLPAGAGEGRGPGRPPDRGG